MSLATYRRKRDFRSTPEAGGKPGRTRAGRRLDRLEDSTAPFQNPPRMRGAHWVKPELAAEISFTGWTDDGLLRHPSFQGLREDKPPRDVVVESPLSRDAVPNARREAKKPGGKGDGGKGRRGRAPKRAPVRRRTPRKPPRRRPPLRDPDRKPPVQEPPPRQRSPIQEPPDNQEVSVAGVVLTHPKKVLYPEQGLSKLDLARYLERVSALMLPHVTGRPLMLLRCPEGRGRECFFQKHPSGAVHPTLEPIEIEETKGTSETYLMVRDASGLIALVQMGVLEIHIWGARGDRIEQPDRVVFDLDPDPSVPWSDVIDAAHRVRQRLGDYGLESFVKTTGGKGIHVLAPIRRGPGWEEIKTFSSAIASELVREAPKRFTTHLSKARRGVRIFVDTLRNRRGATWVAPYSPRAISGAPVSTPVQWSELTARMRADSFTVTNLGARLARTRKDPWRGMDALRQTIPSSVLRRIRVSS